MGSPLRIMLISSRPRGDATFRIPNSAFRIPNFFMPKASLTTYYSLLTTVFSGLFALKSQEIVHKFCFENFYIFHKVFCLKCLTNTRDYVIIFGHVKRVWV